jgi:hypothetical protein
MENQTPLGSALPKNLMPLLVASILLSLIAVVLSVYSLVRPTEQTNDQPSSEVVTFEDEDVECNDAIPCSGDFVCDDGQCVGLTECTKDSECDVENYCYKGSCTQLLDVRSETFHSEHGDFDYTLSWNTNLIRLTETSELLSSDNAPSFLISGGGTISVATGWIDSPGYSMNTFINDMYYGGDRVWPIKQPTPTDAGTENLVYYFTPENDGSCLINYAVMKGIDEALVIRLEDCDGNDMKSSEAFGDLIGDVELISTNERYK